MDQDRIIDGLLWYLGLVILLTFHEFGHAWTAMKCGDDTAKDEGRVSLNPLVHLDPIGTGLIPLLQFVYPWLGGYLLGWAKPVPVNLNNLRSPKLDDILISMAGPAMNVLLAIILVILGRILELAGYEPGVILCHKMAYLSLILCFFNLIPIPPLDGSHVMRVLVGMDYGVYMQISQYGFLLVIGLMNLLPYIPKMLNDVTVGTLLLMMRIVGLV